MLKTTCFFLVLVTVFSGVAGKPRDAKAAKSQDDEVFEEHKNWMISPEEVQARNKKRGFDLLGATSSSILGGNVEGYGPSLGWTGTSLGVAGGLGIANTGYFSSAYEQSPWVQYQMSPQILHSIGFQPALGSALGHLQVGVGLTPQALPMMGEVVGAGIVNRPQIVQFVQPVRARYVKVRMMVPGYLKLAGVMLNPLPCKDTCQLQFEVGKCAPGEGKRPQRHWFHNVQLDTCDSFIYSGCGGNDNNFATPQQCMDACVQRKPCKPGYRHPTPTSKMCVPIPINGGFTPWSEYGRCSRDCGVGFQVRTRTCTNPVPRFGGRNCVGARVEKRFCRIRSCAVNGGYSAWTEYGACSKTCGVGFQRRTRTCTRPAPAYGGADCSRLGPAVETRSCKYKDCPINGAYTRWTEWGSCSADCGDGTQIRTRTCTNPAPAFGGMPCQGMPTETRSCKIKECAINGAYTKWTEWGSCSADCGDGTQMRTRTCTNPAPAFGGADCMGKPTEMRACKIKECPINGAYTKWTEWGSCSADCGDGTQMRTRTCTNPAPAFGGMDCMGKPTEMRACKIKECKIPDPCEINKGGCSHYCKFSGKRGDPAVCSCDKGYELAGDQKTCVEIATCRTAADVGFILDASGSLKKHFSLEKQFLNTVAGAFSITPTGSRASVITFSDRAVLSIKFADFSNIIEFSNKVNAIKNFDSNTRIDLALKLAKNEMFTVANGMRPKLPNILFLITDGSQTVVDGSVEPAPIAAELRKSGIHLICVGIGEEVSVDELAKIAGNRNDVYTAADFQTLVSQSFIDNIKAKACPGNTVAAGSSSASLTVGGGSVGTGSFSVAGGSSTSGSLSVGGGSAGTASFAVGGAGTGSFSAGGGSSSTGSFQFGSQIGSVKSVTTTTYKMTINGQDYAFAVGSDGTISLNGKALVLLASDSSEYPATGGYKMFTQGGVKFYFTMNGKGGQPQFIPDIYQQAQIKIGANTYNFKIYKGYVVVNNQKIPMIASPSTKYPAADGYKLFIYQGIQFYYIIRDGTMKIIPLVKQTGVIKVEIDGVTYQFTVTPNGQLSIQGKQLVMTPSTNSKFPIAEGWRTFTYLGKTFYFAKIDGHYKLVHVTSGSAMLHASVNGKAYNFVYAAGQLSSNDGQQVNLADSTSSKYLMADGWKMFTYQGIKFYFSKADGKLQLVPAPSSKVHMVIGSKTYDFTISDNGQVTRNGTPLLVTTSSNPKYLGLKTWSVDGYNFYLNNAGGKIDVKVEMAIPPDQFGENASKLNDEEDSEDGEYSNLFWE